MAGEGWTTEVVEDLYRGILNRPPDATGLASWRNQLENSGPEGLPTVISAILRSDEARRRISLEQQGRESLRRHPPEAIDDFNFRVPQNLRRTKKASTAAILIGSCLMDNWSEILKGYDKNLSIDRITFNNGSSLPSRDADYLSKYDFQIVQVPLRAVLPEGLFYQLKFGDLNAYEEAFQLACDRLKQNIEAALSYNALTGITSFLLGFQVPQQNPTGRLQPRYRIDNLVFFIEQLNIKITEYIQDRTGCHFVDFDSIISSFGKKYYQDDSISHSNHGSQLGSATLDADKNRLEPVADVRAMYAPDHRKVIISVYEEARAAMNAIQQTDNIKIAIFDLDDTLWRGVLAEQDSVNSNNIEGWPLGMLEAVTSLWRRGVLLAITSKNDEARTRAAWDKLYGKLFPIDRFASVKISWNSKVSAIAEILAEVNLLPGNALFVDDNPVERQQVIEAYPEIRQLGGNLLEWRRVLLWSGETQRAAITDEAIARTEMIQAQIVREKVSTSMDRQSFLKSLQLEVSIKKISDIRNPLFARSFELINKTNQFNTTGRRWTNPELQAVFDLGGYLVAGVVSDRFTDYGLVSLAVIFGDRIEQIVMSCRVFGLGVEHAMLSAIRKMMGEKRITANLTQTEKNALTLTLFSDAGFEFRNNLWVLSDDQDLEWPEHALLKTGS